MNMIKKELKLEDREFFKNIRSAVFANPFSRMRQQTDQSILGVSHNANEPTLVRKLEDILEKVLSRILVRPSDMSRFAGKDADLLEFGVTFYIFHKYALLFDGHIKEQMENKTDICPVTFAQRAIGDLCSYTIAPGEALRYFSLFFQMRRAFFFINRIVGPSRSMKDFRESLWNNVFTHDIGLYEAHLWSRMEDFSTLLLGPTGTGKGLSAAAIGRSGYIPFNEKSGCFSESFTRAFISINLSQFPEQLLESELFGHKKGAFTGAIENHVGIFERCSPHGAIFMDEIGEVSIPVQIKLLRVLEDRLFSPVGSRREKNFRGRIIAATNQPMDKLRTQGRFRDDFYYRLCSDVIRIPSLSERMAQHKGELEDLLSHVVRRILGKPSQALAAQAKKRIKQSLPADYPWPGNVRELEQCTRRILLKKHYEGDTALLAEDRPDTAGEFEKHLVQRGYTAQELMSTYMRLLYKKHGTYEKVAARVGLDRRTVRKYMDS